MSKKKLLTKMLALALGAVCTLSMIGCTPSGGGNVDSSKTQLKVRNYNGGFGAEWLSAAAKRFEEANATTSFEGGKTGVQVIIDNQKNAISADVQSDYHVLINESVNLYENVASGNFVEIDSVFKEANSDGKTIESKLLPNQKEAIQIDGHYYAVPHYQTFGGATYDVTLFESESLYLGKDGQFGQDGSDRSLLSVGPDGKAETYDDGLPATYEEFNRLLDYMKSTVTPFIWSGKSSDYSTYLLSALYTSAVGAKANYNYTFNSGEDKINVIDFDSNGNPQVSQVAITENTANNLFQQAEKYYALEFFANLTGTITSPSGYVDGKSATTQTSMTETHKIFIESSAKPNNTGSGKPIAMIVEGNYWLNESKQAYQDANKVSTKNYAHLPLPTVKSGEVTNGVNSYTLVDQAECFMMINAKAVKDNAVALDLAKKFIMFLNTDESLAEYTTITNTTKALNYTLTDEQKASLTYHGRDIYEAKQRALENNVLLYFGSTSALYTNTINSFSLNNSRYFWRTKIGGETYDTPIIALFNQGKTAQEFFSGMKVEQSKWEADHANHWSVK